jgi:alpha-beta hydrolase superfamily lysophospholipase
MEATGSARQDTVTSVDGTQLHRLSWLPPDDTARASVVFVHGLGEWCAAYAFLGPAFLERSFALHAFDLRGHGLSGGHRMFVSAWEDFRADVGTVLDVARRDAPDRPVFLFGISMGGLIVLNYALHAPEGLAGILALGPAVGENGASKLLQMVVPVLSLLAPKLALDPKLDLSNIARDQEVVRAHITDPHYQVKVTARMGAELLSATDETRERASELRLPLFLGHGSADRITAAAGTRAFAERVSSSDRTFHLYEGAWHGLLLDDDRERVLGDVLDWIAARSS